MDRKINRRKFIGGLGVGLLTVGLTGCGLNTAIDGEKITGDDATPAAKAVPDKGADGVPNVYMTTDINPKGLMDVYKVVNRPVTGKVAIKLHMGEPGNTNYLPPELIRELTLAVDGTFVDSNTAYGGRRANTAAHIQVAKEHGFTYAPVDILDADGEVSLPITGGKHLEEAILGSHYSNYDFIISIAHFKGHLMAGFGGTFKNLAIGMSSVKGKTMVHTGSAEGNIFAGAGDQFLERIAECTKAVIEDKGNRMVYINVLNNLSVDCDCAANAAKPGMEDIGILASLDPVALDKASVDLIYAAPEKEREDLVERIESRNGTHLLDYAEELGLGNQKYNLVRLNA